MRAVASTGAAGILALLLIGAAPAQAGDTLSLASGRPDTPAYTAGVGLSSLIKFELLPKEKIDLQILTSSGPVENVNLLRRGEVDLAILPAATGHSARLGTGSFAGEAPATGLRAIATLWRDALHLVVREGDVATGTIDDLSRLKDRRLFLGDAASGMIDAGRMLLADLGMQADRSFELTTVADGDGIAAIKRGDVDAFSAMVRPPEAIFDAVFDQAPSGLRVLDVTESQMAAVNGNHWLWTPYVIPAATYPGQQKDIWTIALSSLLVVRDDVEPDVVYAITKSIFENLSYLKRIDPAMADLSLETALAGVAMPLHAGALRYYSEAGLIPMASSEREDIPPGAVPAERDPPTQRYLPTQRYPDDDVAGSWTTGVGGPLLKPQPADLAPGLRAPKAGERPGPKWRRRATI